MLHRLQYMLFSSVSEQYSSTLPAGMREFQENGSSAYRLRCTVAAASTLRLTDALLSPLSPTISSIDIG